MYKPSPATEQDNTSNKQKITASGNRMTGQQRTLWQQRQTGNKWVFQTEFSGENKKQHAFCGL